MKTLKYVLGAILCVAVVGTANADDRITNCGYVADLATIIMEGRQTGTAAREFLEVPSPISALVEEMVLRAYTEYDRVHSASAQQRIIQEFANEWYIICLTVTR